MLLFTCKNGRLNKCFILYSLIEFNFMDNMSTIMFVTLPNYYTMSIVLCLTQHYTY